MNYIFHIIIIALVIGSVYWIFWESGQSNAIETAVQNAEDVALDSLGKIVSISDAGDVIEIFKGSPTIIQQAVFVDSDGDELTQDEFIQIANSTGTLTDDDIVQMFVTGGTSYGHTVQYKKKELPENTYQIGNPVLFNGKLKKVVDGSCKYKNNEVDCDYISPAVFTYTFSVSCDHIEFCNLNAIQKYGQKTTNSGVWEQKIQTNLSDFVKGEYLMTIDANSEVINPETNAPYVIHGETKFNMVN